MNGGRTRAQVQAHWRAFDALSTSQGGGNEAIIRALDVFEGARDALNSAPQPSTSSLGAVAHTPASMTSAAATLSDVRERQHLQQQEQRLGEGMPTFPSGNANTNAFNDRSRLAYFRAEEGLTLAREQLTRNEENLRLMADEVENARRCVGSGYDTEGITSAQERRDVRARASQQALDRGEVGCLMSLVGMVRAMAGLLRMYQSELEMQETIIYGLGYDTPGEVITAYRETLNLRPFIDDRFLSQVQEIRDLSEELEHSMRQEDSQNIQGAS